MVRSRLRKLFFKPFKFDSFPSDMILIEMKVIMVIIVFFKWDYVPGIVEKALKQYLDHYVGRENVLKI